MEGLETEIKGIGAKLTALFVMTGSDEKMDYIKKFFGTVVDVDSVSLSLEIEKIRQNIDVVIVQENGNLCETPTIIKKNILIKNATVMIVVGSDLSINDVYNLSAAGVTRFISEDMEGNHHVLKSFKSILGALLTEKTRMDSYVNRPKHDTTKSEINVVKKQEKRGKFVVIEPVIPSQNILKRAFSLAGISESKYKFYDSYEQALGTIGQNLSEYGIVIIGGVESQMDSVKAFVALGCDLYVQVISGARDQKQLQEFVSSGVDEVITKPFELEQLVEKLRKAEIPADAVANNSMNKSVYNMKNLVDAYNDFAVEEDLKSIHKDFFKRYFTYLQFR